MDQYDRIEPDWNVNFQFIKLLRNTTRQNRTRLECKFIKESKSGTKALDRIEPDWNVNTRYIELAFNDINDRIEPDWNVNFVSMQFFQ